MGGGYSIMDGGDGKVTLHGTVPSEDARTAAIDGATAIFGDGNVTDELTVDTTAVTGPDAAAFGKVLTALKGAGSGWMAEVSGTDTLTLTGEVASDAAKSSLVKAVTAAFAPGTVVDKLTVAAASAEDTSAVEAINKEIRLRGVNFVTGSATLTGPSKTTLDRVAKLLTEAKTVRAEVQGHTDSQGDASANLALSSARAKAVVAYLVGKGIAADRLVAKGYGETTPRGVQRREVGRGRHRCWLDVRGTWPQGRVPRAVFAARRSPHVSSGPGCSTKGTGWVPPECRLASMSAEAGSRARRWILRPVGSRPTASGSARRNLRRQTRCATRSSRSWTCSTT
jgi:OOP family OmpA-OmpF porin